MLRKLSVFVWALCASSVCLAAPPDILRGDRHTFEVPAVSPALPAMKYELTVDVTRLKKGDAASLYMQGMLMISSDREKEIDDAMDLHEKGQSLASGPLVESILRASAFDFMEIASLKDRCDWNSPFHEMGIKTLLPQLNHMRELANLERIKVIHLIDSNKIDEAVAGIRIEYAMARHTGSDGPLVSNLVGVGISAVGNELVADLMARPDCPNLYWPLMNLDHPGGTVREGLENERRWLIAEIPVLAKGKAGGITADDWDTYFQQTANLMAFNRPAGQRVDTPLDRLAMGMAATPAASEYYAQTRHLSADAVAKVDSRLVLATYFIEQYQIVADEMTKVLGLPLPEAIERCAKMQEHLKELGVHIDGTGVAATMIPSLSRTPITFGRSQRSIAALATIEALRAYAAGHDGKLPVKLEDVTETPVPVNPMTGKMFDYRMEDAAATVSDTTTPGSDEAKGFPLVYTLKLVGK